MNTTYLPHSYSWFSKHLLKTYGRFRGASRLSIMLQERNLGRRFAPSHKEMLRWMGGRERGVMTGSDCSLQRLQEIQDAAAELQKLHDIGFSVEDDIAFFGHQGYQVAWYHAQSGDNPPCVYFIEREEISESICHFDSIDDFLVSLFQGFDSEPSS